MLCGDSESGAEGRAINRTKIPWADYTWNPITGCSPVSAGCARCYASAMSKRFGWPWGKASFHHERFEEPLHIKKPSRIFVCSMGDLGHATVKQEWRDQIVGMMRAVPRHTYIILTKRPGPWLAEFAPFAWVGVTIESQKYIHRWRELIDYCSQNHTVRFVSVEPMLGPVTFREFYLQSWPDWVIAGPENGPGARPCDPKWIDDLAAESPCFFDKRMDWKRRDWPK